MALPTTRRRDFLALCAGASAACAPFAHLAGRAHGRQTLRAVVFDAFPIFDPRSLDRSAEQLFPGRGAELMTLWRTRQFEYSWLRAAANRHVDFWRVTDDALAFAAGSLGLDLTTAARASLMQGYLTLDAWPDVREAIAALADSGLVLGFLSNFTDEMLAGCVAHAELGGVFRRMISTESARTFKPDPRAYRLGTDAFGLERGEILFVASAAWDAAGAAWFGYPTFWVNRNRAAPEVLDARMDGTGSSLVDLVAFVRGS